MVTTTLLVVRHAQTDGNLARIFQGQIDRELSEAGKCQLELLTNRFKTMTIHAIYTSPLPRAVKTAKAIAVAQPVPVMLDDRLMEINAGKFEGRRWDVLPQLYPVEFALWRDDLGRFHAPGGESCAAVYDRMRCAALSIAKRHKGQIVAVVSHGCAIKNLLCWASGFALERIMDMPWVENTSISRIEIDEQENPHIAFINDTAHLDGIELPRPVYWEGKR